MALYWALGFFFFGYPTYIVTALAVTMVVFVAATLLSKEESFLEGILQRLGNNNWVLLTASWMLLGVIILWWLDPTAPEFRKTVGMIWGVIKDPLGSAWGVIKNPSVLKGLLTSRPLEDPLHRGQHWTVLSHFFFGSDGVGPVALWIQFWGWFFAIFVSKWDEVGAGLKGVSAGEGLKKLAGKHLLGEVITQPLEWIWAILKAPFK